MACTQIASLQGGGCNFVGVLFISIRRWLDFKFNAMHCNAEQYICNGSWPLHAALDIIILWFYWKWKIAMIMNTHLLQQFNNNNVASLLFCSRSICLISHYHINVIAVVVVVVVVHTFWCDIEISILAFMHTHTLLMAIHSWRFSFSFVILCIWFPKWNLNFYVCWQFHIQWLDLARFVLSSALINSNAAALTIASSKEPACL